MPFLFAIRNCGCAVGFSELEGRLQVEAVLQDLEENLPRRGN